MKRSKMVGKLLHFLSTNGFRTGDTYDSYVPLASDASDILSELEKLGMLPPENDKVAGDVISYRNNCLKWDEE